MIILKRILQTRLHICTLMLFALTWSLSIPTLLAQETGVDFATQTVRLALTGEPRNLNSMKATDQLSIFYLEHVMEGLLRKDARNLLVGGVAERWEMTDTSAKFWLRHDAMWSDGKPVTAHDFVFAWRNVVNPLTASEYASIMYPVKNAEAINKGEAPLTSLGIKALDDYTLEVELEAPTGYFLSLTAFMTFYPAREDFYMAQDGRYFADIENMIFNGPFTITNWVHSASIRMEKNLAYWDSNKIILNLIDTPYITNDSAARFNLFKDGKLAIENGLQGLESEQLQDALDNRFRIHSHSEGSVFFVEFNHRPDRVTRNLNLRKAMQAVYDSQELVYKVIGIAGYIPGRSVVPVYMPGVQLKFREEYPLVPPVLDLQKAKNYLALSKVELGLDKIPPLSILVDDREIGMLQAQYFQSLFKRTLDIDIKVDVQTFKQRLDKMLAGNFDLVLAGWGPDYEDVLTFTELFSSWNANNRGRYQSPVYDSYIRTAQASANQKTRMDAMSQAQQLILDDVVILPTYERVANTVRNPKLDGVMFKQTAAAMVLTYARVLE